MPTDLRQEAFDTTPPGLGLPVSFYFDLPAGAVSVALGPSAWQTAVPFFLG